MKPDVTAVIVVDDEAPQLAGTPLAERQRRMLTGIFNLETKFLIPDLLDSSVNTEAFFPAIKENLILHPREWLENLKTSGTSLILLLDGTSLFNSDILKVCLDYEGPVLPLILSDEKETSPSFASWTTELGENRYLVPGVFKIPRDTFLATMEKDSGSGFHTFMHQAIDDENIPQIILGEEGAYSYDMRRRIPLYFQPVLNEQDIKSAMRILLSASNKYVLDFPAYLHRPIENLLVKYLADTTITPNQITLLTNGLGVVAAFFFAYGQPLPGVLLAMLVGIGDGLDGKLARVKYLFSPVGKLEHFFDKIYEILWFLCIGHGLRALHPQIFLIPCTALLILCHLLDSLLVAAFKKETGKPIDDFGFTERLLRFIGGRRNTYIWVFLPFVIAEQPFAGFLVMGGYAVVSLVLRFQRYLHVIRGKKA